jgi:hypothetical protein
MHRYVSLFVVSCLCLVLVGCSSNDAPDLGDWTLKTSGMSLNETLRVSETDAFYFGSIAGQELFPPGPGLDVLSDGRMVVADTKAQHLKLLRPDGTLIDTLGGPGQGPGEFQRLSSVQVARGDSIYAYSGRRLAVFAPTPPHEVVRTVSLEAERMPPFRVLVTGPQLVALYGTPFMAGRDLDASPVRHPWRHIDETGTPGDTLVTTEMRRMASRRREARGFTMHPMPFDRNAQVTPGPDHRLYVGHTDSLHVQAYRPDGSLETVASVPAEAPPVQEADRDSALADVENSAMRDKVASALSDTKPAMTDLVVAGDGRLWVRRPLDGPDANMVPWWVLDPDAKTIHEVQLPVEVNLAVVRNGNAYGTTTTEMGAPAVVRYRIAS